MTSTQVRFCPKVVGLHVGGYRGHLNLLAQTAPIKGSIPCKTDCELVVSTCATDSSNSSGSAPFSLAIFFRAVNILAAYQMLGDSLHMRKEGIRRCKHCLLHISNLRSAPLILPIQQRMTHWPYANEDCSTVRTYKCRHGDGRMRETCNKPPGAGLRRLSAGGTRGALHAIAAFRAPLCHLQALE